MDDPACFFLAGDLAAPPVDNQMVLDHLRDDPFFGDLLSSQSCLDLFSSANGYSGGIGFDGFCNFNNYNNNTSNINDNNNNNVIYKGNYYNNGNDFNNHNDDNADDEEEEEEEGGFVLSGCSVYGEMDGRNARQVFNFSIAHASTINNYGSKCNNNSNFNNFNNINGNDNSSIINNGAKICLSSPSSSSSSSFSSSTSSSSSSSTLEFDLSCYPTDKRYVDAQPDYVINNNNNNNNNNNQWDVFAVKKDTSTNVLGLNANNNNLNNLNNNNNNTINYSEAAWTTGLHFSPECDFINFFDRRDDRRQPQPSLPPLPPLPPPHAILDCCNLDYRCDFVREEAGMSLQWNGTISGCSNHRDDDDDDEKQRRQQQQTTAKSTARKGQVRVPGEQRQRRSANARERDRTYSVNAAFNRLRSIIPTDPPQRKLSKIETIRLATCYMAHLMTLLGSDAPDQPCVKVRGSLTRLLKSRKLVDLDLEKDGERLRRMLRGEMDAEADSGPTMICTFCLSASKSRVSDA